MPLIIPSNSITGGYEVANSLRFDDGSSDYLEITPASAGNRQTCTVSAWVKRSNIVNANIIGCWSANNDNDNINITLRNNGELRIVAYTINWRVLNRLFRDVSAWYHIVVAFDTTQSTANDRIKVYINGTQETSFSTINNPSQNSNIGFNQASTTRIGTQANALSNYFDGYMAEVVFIDGTALDPTSFGEFDADTGIWKPIDVSGLTFGTNGFYLDFESSGSLGSDVSGNGNNFTVNNLTSIDQTTDTCTNNSATLNTLDKNISNVTLSDGNLTMSTSGSNYGVRGTMGVVSGKWYWESKVVTRSGSNNVIAGGIAKSDWNLRYVGNTSTSIGYAANGLIYSTGNNEGAYGATYTTGDIIGVALDMDSLTLTFYKNGVSQGAVSSVFTASDFIFPAFSGQTGDVVSANFGSPAFTISSGNSDGNGYGNFEYSVPSGYYALNTKNLSEYG